MKSSQNALASAKQDSMSQQSAIDAMLQLREQIDVEKVESIHIGSFEVEYKGIFHTVWKRQSDNSWKYVWD